MYIQFIYTDVLQKSALDHFAHRVIVLNMYSNQSYSLYLTILIHTVYCMIYEICIAQFANTPPAMESCSTVKPSNFSRVAPRGASSCCKRHW